MNISYDIQAMSPLLMKSLRVYTNGHCYKCVGEHGPGGANGRYFEFTLEGVSKWSIAD